MTTTLKRMLVLVSLFGFGNLLWSGHAEAQRPEAWGRPVEGSTISNLSRIEPDLYRSAQPDARGFEEIQTRGIKTVLCLRSNQDDDKPARGTSVHLLHVSMRAWSLREDKVVEALRIMNNPDNRPLLVHCQHGADRTGGVIAMYRVVVQGWTKEEALREMKQGGYHFHGIWGNIPKFIETADIAWYRKQLGIEPPKPVVAETPRPE